jgi:hypothetical protein
MPMKASWAVSIKSRARGLALGEPRERTAPLLVRHGGDDHVRHRDCEVLLVERPGAGVACVFAQSTPTLALLRRKGTSSIEKMAFGAR